MVQGVPLNTTETIWEPGGQAGGGEQDGLPRAHPRRRAVPAAGADLPHPARLPGPVRADGTRAHGDSTPRFTCLAKWGKRLMSKGSSMKLLFNYCPQRDGSSVFGEYGIEQGRIAAAVVRCHPREKGGQTGGEQRRTPHLDRRGRFCTGNPTLTTNRRVE